MQKELLKELKIPTNSPWGRIQEVEVICDGMFFVTTASHGGLKLDQNVNILIPKEYRRDGGWYEEDCEWTIPALIFSEQFEKYKESVERICKNYYPEFFTQITGIELTIDDSYILGKRDFEAKTIHEFVVTAAWGNWHKEVPNGFVGVLAKRAMQKKYFFVPENEYKTRNEYGFVINDTHKEWIPSWIVDVEAT